MCLSAVLAAVVGLAVAPCEDDRPAGKLRVVGFGDRPDDPEPGAIWEVHDRMHRRRGAECGVAVAEAYTLVGSKEGCPLLAATFLARKDACPAPADARRDERGIVVHTVDSPHQAGQTKIRVLAPDALTTGARYPVVYVLPVEAGDEHRFGDGLLEVRRHGLHNAQKAIFVAPTFSHLPWYADHPTVATLRQETHFLDVVVPFVEARYPAQAGRDGRLLLGFSKSGWGAWSLLLRHPDRFGKAAAWDAPLMMDRPGKYGSGEIFGTDENFKRYQVSELLRRGAVGLRDRGRLILLGYGGFRNDHEAAHALLADLKVPHVYEDGPKREHRWESGWLPEAAGMLLKR